MRVSPWLCSVSKCTSHTDPNISTLSTLCTDDTVHPAVILEGKSPAVEASRGAGEEREPSSLVEDQRPAAAAAAAAWLSPNPPATLPLTQAELPGSPWQSESLMAESWSTMGDVDREETKSLDSSNSDGGAPGAAGEERSENHSSMSDMVHLEREEAELLLEEAEKAAAEAEEAEEEEDEEDDELQGSVLSVLGGESELAELREEELDLTRGTGGVTMQVVPPMALPPLPIVRLEPPSSTSTPVPALTAAELEQLLSTQALHPPPVLSAEAGSQPLDQPLHPVEEPAAAASQGAAAPTKGEPEKAGAEKAGPEKAGPEKTGPEQSGPHHGTGELPMMLCGGAALVAVVGVVAYGAVVYCRK